MDKPCENCKKVHNGKYGSGRFCNAKCARGFSSKDKRKEINEKVSKTLTGSGKGAVTKVCPICDSTFIIAWKRRNQITCSKKCCATLRWTDDEYRNKITESIKLRCQDPVEKQRLKKIGRYGGFGTKGYTSGGIYYQSMLEKKCFEILESKKIIFEPHKQLPNSVKESDIYLPNENYWIELDGINREKQKKYLGKNYINWQNKLDEYRQNNLKLIIIYTVSEFEEYINLLYPSAKKRQ